MDERERLAAAFHATILWAQRALGAERDPRLKRFLQSIHRYALRLQIELERDGESKRSRRKLGRQAAKLEIALLSYMKQKYR